VGCIEILVVGAGPAGAIAARGLALAGARVTMVDKARFPRRKVCGCCLNGNALAALESVGLGDLPAKLGAVPLHSFVTASAGRIATVPLKGVSLSRDAMDVELIEEAVKAGVDFKEGVTHSLQTGGTASPCSTITVFANGLNGVPSTASETSRLGAGTILDDAPAFYEPGRIYMAVGKGGYVGLVRLEDGRLDVAAAFDPGFVKTCGGLAEAAERVIEEAGFPASFSREPTASAAAWKGTPSLTRTPTRIAGPGWFAVGDAAGYVEPFTGEGMAWAISGAAAAVPFILRNDPDGWTREHRRIIGRRQRTCRGLARLLRSPGIYNWVVRGLNRFPSLARPVVRALNQPS
jgi:flavin-dependent dehydrogenase